MRVFSGIQPSGELHLGNYLGALRNWVAMQDQAERDTDVVFCIVDLHALTLPKAPGEVGAATMELARTLLAIGIDPARCVLFVQSHVHQHAELAWLMQCTAAFGELRRMTQFKDKSDRAEFISAGLFTYPALQAADILLYDTDVVPVGDDQRQHVEITRDLAERFNSRYGDTFVVPAHHIPKAGARIMDLQTPTNKMSKSLESPQGTIGLLDSPQEITKKIKRAVTDTDNEVRFDPVAKPGVSNLLSILAAATDADPEVLAGQYSQYGPLKSDAADALVALLEPIQARHAELDPASTVEALNLGAGKARQIADEVMTRARSAVGLLALG
jgi:tryptophanyl-tRNA synthetase